MTILSKTNIRKIILLTVILSVFGIFSHHASAQAVSLPDVSGLQTAPFTLKYFPIDPGPGQEVNFTVEGFGTDLNRSTITWIVNGKVILRGIGKTTFTTITGGVGQTLNVSTVVITPDGKDFTERTVIRPARGVDIVWEASSYTPPFYKGKALFPYHGAVTLEAIPNFIRNGQRLNPKNMIYTWKIDNQIISDSSGYGKNSTTLQANGLNIDPLVISVSVSSYDGTITGNGRVTIPAVQPTSEFYENNPLYGVLYNRALAQNFKLNQKEIVLETTPYFFSTTGLYNTQALTFDWSINGNKINSTDVKNQILLRAPQGSSGASTLSVQITNPKKLLQYQTSNILIGFGN
jgi:hypothetical protein